MTPGGIVDLTRLIDAPRSTVFEACVDGDQLAEWWGPRGFSVPGAEVDARPGGSYRITMQPPDGDAFHLEGEYREVQPPDRLAYTFRWQPPDPDDVETIVTLTFAEAGEGTEVTLHQGAFKTESRRLLHEEGWADTLDRLAEYLESAGHA